MRRIMVSALLHLVIAPAAAASWWLANKLGALSRAYDEAWLLEIFRGQDDLESMPRPRLVRSLQWVFESAQRGTASCCRRHGEGPHL
jgi:hypothetical protein